MGNLKTIVIKSCVKNQINSINLFILKYSNYINRFINPWQQPIPYTVMVTSWSFFLFTFLYPFIFLGGGSLDSNSHIF